MSETDLAAPEICPEGTEICVKVYVTSDETDLCAVVSLDGFMTLPSVLKQPEPKNILRAALGDNHASLEEAFGGPLRLMTAKEIWEYKREND